MNGHGISLVSSSWRTNPSKKKIKLCYNILRRQQGTDEPFTSNDSREGPSVTHRHYPCTQTTHILTPHRVIEHAKRESKESFMTFAMNDRDDEYKSKLI